MKKIILSLMVLASVAFGSATIISGSTQAIAINSDPSGAKVYVDGQLRGVTPMSVMMDKTLSSHAIRVVKQGYADINVPMTKELDPVSILSIIWDACTTDVLTGNVMEYAPNNYYFTLEKK
ncbi:MAG: PEGA domain-containing protein [Candidatus Marinimicrobia bacterium]|jgi:hypothetical protein|nr:PEGA domain-containing protein [Campylobacteraceae bacterium]MBT4707951.1 PEGA domain-containing protein [Campylobacteraceae bacterium]MBT7830342.1 PEGA domain-containing protein [Candidatus Neomarinimicrobiota bacterium]